MFNLIISIIAIALVVVLAGASLYYGGSAFNEGSSDATAATLINQAQQIQASATLYSATEGGSPADITDLEGEYLSAIPIVPVGHPTDDQGAPIGDLPTWELAASGDGSGPIDMVSVDLQTGSKADEGITLDICETVNEDGAGVVHCSASASAVVVDLEVGGVIDAGIPAAGSNAVVFMAL